MRYLLKVAAAALFALTACGVALQRAHASLPSPSLSNHQARQIVRLVARHDRIDLSDTRVEMNSLDLTSPFIPGFASFIFIREASTPGPDQTLRRFAVNRHTGDVWEMTRCRRYDFPALENLQRAFVGHLPAPAAIAAESRELGCSSAKSATPGASAP